ncbi:hypothetical protein [Ruminococcus sp.]|jgi:DNA-directed RNA polymerase specialized sigma subunit|uniref:hypothetical protein n=1 Tax=Ruminococcus sp. TaxID=41978 RepID=UPI0025EACD77|nr:hypothetical protein [Ruminococcus sp.]
MTPKEYMIKANALLRRIKRKRREAEEIRITEGSPSSPALNDMPKITTYDPHKMSKRIGRAIDLDREADIAFNELEELKRSLLASIETLENPDERDLLYKRYIEFKCWRKVSEEIGYSESHTKRLHSMAVKKMILDDTL